MSGFGSPSPCQYRAPTWCRSRLGSGKCRWLLKGLQQSLQKENEGCRSAMCTFNKCDSEHPGFMSRRSCVNWQSRPPPGLPGQQRTTQGSREASFFERHSLEPARRILNFCLTSDMISHLLCYNTYIRKVSGLQTSMWLNTCMHKCLHACTNEPAHVMGARTSAHSYVWISLHGTIAGGTMVGLTSSWLRKHRNIFQKTPSKKQNSQVGLHEVQNGRASFQQLVGLRLARNRRVLAHRLTGFRPWRAASLMA